MLTAKQYRTIVYRGYLAFDASVDVFTDDGEFVLRNGNRDFGEISTHIASSIHRQSGKIRLRIGDAKVGQQHIDGREDRRAQIASAGYRRAAELIADVADNFDAIYEGRGRRLLIAIAKKKPIPLAVIELTPDRDGDFYDALTARISRADTFKNEKPLWERAQTNHGA